MPLRFDAVKNLVKVTVSTGYDNTATTVVLNSGQGALLPAPPFNATWWNSTDYGDPSDDPNVEIIRVYAVAGDTLSILRAQENTVTATTKNTASKTYSMIAGLTALAMATIATALLEGSDGLNQLQTDLGLLIQTLVAEGIEVPDALHAYLN